MLRVENNAFLTILRSLFTIFGVQSCSFLRLSLKMLLQLGYITAFFKIKSPYHDCCHQQMDRPLSVFIASRLLAMLDFELAHHQLVCFIEGFSVDLS